MRYLREDVCPEIGRKPPDLIYSKGQGARLAKAIHDYGEDKVALLLDWYASNDDRAVFLRSKKLFLTTILRPSLIDGYLDLAEETFANSKAPPTNLKERYDTSIREHEDREHPET